MSELIYNVWFIFTEYSPPKLSIIIKMKAKKLLTTSHLVTKTTFPSKKSFPSPELIPLVPQVTSSILQKEKITKV